MEVYLLGRFQVNIEGEAISQLNHARLQELLAYLLLHRGKPVSRQQIAFLFWPDTSEEQARTNLRNLLHRLRKALPASPQFLIIDETRIHWRTDIDFSLDIAEFDALVLQAESAPRTERIDLLEKALAVYGGDLLPECFSDWLLSERERFHQGRLSILKTLAELYESQRVYAKAVAKVQELVRLESLDENAYAWLMRLLALEGNRGQALHVYHTCAETIHRELGIEPGPAVRSLYENLLHTPVLSGPTAPATALVGRQAEWEVLTSAWRGLIHARHSLQFFLIGGEAGIGKTHLAQAFVDWVQRQGYLTASATCYEGGRELAYAPLAGLLADLFQQEERRFDRLPPHWRSEISRLLPELRARYPELEPPASLSEKWQLLHFYESLRQCFNFLRGPLLLFIDDIQWCDEETLAWLAYLQSKPADQKIAFIATARSEALATNHPLRDLVRNKDQYLYLELPPLAEVETRRLVDQLVGEPIDADLAQTIYRQSEGNPLFATEMARLGSGLRQGIERALPERIQSVIEWRLDHLSHSARQVIELGAVIGRSFSYDLLQAASSLDEQTLVDGIDECWRQRIVREKGSLSYDFSHDLLRQVVYDGLSQARRRLCHKQAAVALEQIHAADADPAAEQIAQHYENAGQIDRAVLFYERAAQAAHQLFALSQAVWLLEHAIRLLEHEPVAGTQMARLYEQLGSALLTSGQYPAAHQALEAAGKHLDAGDAISRARLQRRIAQAWSSQQLYDEAGQAFQNALTELGNQPPAGLESEWMQEGLETRLRQADYLYFKNQPDEMQVVCDLLEEPLQEFGTLAQQSDFYTVKGMLANRRERFRISANTVQIVRHALSLAEQSGDPLLIARKRFGLGFNLLWYGSRQEAIEQLDQAQALSEKLGATFIQNQALAYLTTAFRMEGNQEKVSALAQRGLALSEKENHPTYQGTALANLAWLAYRQDDWAEAERLGQAALPLWGNDRYPFLWLANFPLAAVALRRRDGPCVRNRLADTLGAFQQRLPEELEAGLMQAVSKLDEAATEDDSLEAARHALEIASLRGYL